MLKNHFEYRRKNDFTRAVGYPQSYYETMYKYYVRGLCGITYDGLPVCIEKVGYTNPEELLKMEDPFSVVQDYFTCYYERLINIVFPYCSYLKK